MAAGIKKAGLDLALVFSTRPSIACAVFTRNQVQAAPVLLSMQHLARSRGRVRAILLNSGCANACTGKRGMADASRSAEFTASELGVDSHEVLVASTGVIGTFLPMRKLELGIPAAVSLLHGDGGNDAARAIMTTDTRLKTAAVVGESRGKLLRIGGMVKGAGMIHPQMATMLSVITTDAKMPLPLMDKIFRRVVEHTFNCLTVDGDTSTNDMVLLLSNGAAGAVVDAGSAAFFERGLENVCEELAKSVARDGEGATKYIEISVRGARTFREGRQIAKAIAHSPLVKTAFYGEELNWGRILAAAGYSGVSFDPDRVVLRLCGIPIYRRGAGVDSSKTRAERALKSHDILIELDLAQGKAQARVWTCDLSHDYVNINGSYIS
jgi:glutamate N-acetyltransferase/amino-acid N-acetyltransferase